MLLREYDFKSDPPKMVKYLFDRMNYESGISELRKADEWFLNSSCLRKRLVSEINGELCSTITIEQGQNKHIEHTFNLYSLVTAKQFRGKGLTRLIFNYACDWIRAHGGSILLVDTWEDNISARKFYEKMEFKLYGSIPKGFKGDHGFGERVYYYLPLN